MFSFQTQAVQTHLRTRGPQFIPFRPHNCITKPRIVSQTLDYFIKWSALKFVAWLYAPKVYMKLFNVELSFRAAHISHHFTQCAVPTGFRD